MHKSSIYSTRRGISISSPNRKTHGLKRTTRISFSTHRKKNWCWHISANRNVSKRCIIWRSLKLRNWFANERDINILTEPKPNWEKWCPNTASNFIREKTGEDTLYSLLMRNRWNQTGYMNKISSPSHAKRWGLVRVLLQLFIFIFLISILLFSSKKKYEC